MGKIIVKTEIISFSPDWRMGNTNYWKKVFASSSVTSPISIGSISGPTSRLGRKGPKKARNSRSGPTFEFRVFENEDRFVVYDA